MKAIERWEVIPQVVVINQFFDHPLFIKAFAQLGQKYMAQKSYDHYLFSYHGLPEHQIHYGYQVQCLGTTRLLVKELGIKEGDYTVCFQSRLGWTPWMKPYTDQIVKQLAKKGVKSVLIFSPSFVADCLETTVEIGVEYKKLFEKHRGQHWQMVESLNAHPVWVECLKQLVLQQSRS